MINLILEYKDAILISIATVCFTIWLANFDLFSKLFNFFFAPIPLPPSPLPPTPSPSPSPFNDSILEDLIEDALNLYEAFKPKNEEVANLIKSTILPAILDLLDENEE